MKVLQRLLINDTIFTEGEMVYWEDGYIDNGEGESGFINYKLKFDMEELRWFLDSEDCNFDYDECDFDFILMKPWNKELRSHK